MRPTLLSDAAHGGVWGVARVLRLEHTGLRTQSAEVSRGAGASASMSALLSSDAATEVEAELACGDGMRFAARLRPCYAAGTSSGAQARVTPGVYAITGGLGGLGLRAAVMLVERGATRVLLASRSGRVARDGQGLAAQLQSLGARAGVAVCDSADPADTRALLGIGHSVAGVLHAAGLGDKGLLADLVAARMMLMFAPKAVGAWNVHCASAAVPLEAEVLFSSVGAGLGNVGQTNYAAGNACLDSHALSRRAHGMVGCSLQWPLVGGAGMGAAAFSALGERGPACWLGGYLT